MTQYNSDLFDPVQITNTYKMMLNDGMYCSGRDQRERLDPSVREDTPDPQVLLESRDFLALLVKRVPR